MQESLAQLSYSLLWVIRDLLNVDSASNDKISPVSLTTPFSNIDQSDWATSVRLMLKHGRELIGELPARPCPACGGNDHRPLFDSYDGFPFVECDSCGCWYVPLKIDEALFERFFRQCPEAWAVAQRSYKTRGSDEYAKLSLDRIGEYLDELLPLVGRADGKPRYLDVGCGLGYSLLAARDRGLDGYGVEASTESVSIASRQHLEVRHTSAGLPPGPFQLISFWESLEHMENPVYTLAICLPLLDNDGLLAFTLPNQNSPVVRALRSDCSVINGGYDTPGHINLLSPATLRILLDRAGYTLLELDGQYGTNLNELLSYLMGLNRGAADLLSGRPVKSTMPGAAAAIIPAIGPGVSLLERMFLMTPILFGIACRKGSEGRFGERIAAQRARRRARMVAQIDSILGTQPSLRDQISALQKDLALRDEMLAKLRETLQGEIRLRDGPLTKLQLRVNAFLSRRR